MMNPGHSVGRWWAFKNTKLFFFFSFRGFRKYIVFDPKTSTSFAIELSEKFFNSLNPINAIIKVKLMILDQKQS